MDLESFYPNAIRWLWRKAPKESEQFAESSGRTTTHLVNAAVLFPIAIRYGGGRRRWIRFGDSQ